MDLHGHLVGSERLDRVADLDATLVDLGAGLAEGLGDVGGRDRAEQSSTRASPDGQLDVRDSKLALISLAWPRSRISRAERARLISVICFSAPLVHRIA